MRPLRFSYEKRRAGLSGAPLRSGYPGLLARGDLPPSPLRAGPLPSLAQIVGGGLAFLTIVRYHSSMKRPSTKDHIFEAAVTLFSQKGYHGTSIRDIARRVGIKESSLYNHFPGKRDILDAILSYYRDTFNSGIPGPEEREAIASQHTDPADLWITGISAFLEKMPPLWNRISLILLNEMFLDQQCRIFVLETMFKAQKESTEYLFKDLADRGMIPRQDFHLKAEQYVHMIYGLDIENRLRLLDGEDPQETQQRMFTQMRHFIDEMAKEDQG